MNLLRTLRTFVYSAALLPVFIFIYSPASAQNLWFVFFQPRPETALQPDLSPAALQRRLKSGIAPDECDQPVHAPWVNTVSEKVNKIRYRLRWFNAVTVEADEAQIAEVRALPFVKSVEAFEPVYAVHAAAETDSDTELSTELAELQVLQRNLMHLDTLAAHGLSGRGIRIAVFDAGFKEVDTHPAFEHLRSQNRIEKVRDFYGGEANPYYHAYHGTQVLGCIAGKVNGKPIGAAPDATFLLARTEHFFKEKAIEEDHWLAAVEWADSLGADIISSSLGYTDKRYIYLQLDGRTTRVTQAASLAVRKGMLVVNSQGNEGSGKWKYLGAPADADSVLSVGGTYPMVRYPIPFSSYGPNARNVLKPEVSAPGFVMTTGRKGKYSTAAGTSFACPLVTGYAACVMQLHPEFSNMQVRNAIMESAHLYPFFDYRSGYGVPDAANLFHPRPEVSPTFKVVLRNDSLFFILDTLPGPTDTARLKPGFPFHTRVVGEKGNLLHYQVTLVQTGRQIVALDRKRLPKGLLHVWYRGYLWREEVDFH